jgi:hypothetical protein
MNPFFDRITMARLVESTLFQIPQLYIVRRIAGIDPMPAVMSLFFPP